MEYCGSVRWRNGSVLTGSSSFSGLGVWLIVLKYVWKEDKWCRNTIWEETGIRGAVQTSNIPMK